MKLSKIEYYALLFLSTLLNIIINLGIPFCIAAIGMMIGLWQFSWGLVFLFYVVFREAQETFTVMQVAGIEKDDDNES